MDLYVVPMWCHKLELNPELLQTAIMLIDSECQAAKIRASLLTVQLTLSL